MAQYYTEFQLYLNDGGTLNDTQQPAAKQAVRAARSEILRQWQQHLNPVTDIELNLSDDGVLLQLLITTDGELSNDTYGTSLALIDNTIGFDVYPGTDDEYNAIPLHKYLHQAITDGFNLQWTMDIVYVNPDDTDSLTYDLQAPEKQWFEAQVQ